MSRRRRKKDLASHYVRLPRKIRKRTDPIVKQLAKAKKSQPERSAKGKKILKKKLGKLADRL